MNMIKHALRNNYQPFLSNIIRFCRATWNIDGIMLTRVHLEKTIVVSKADY